MARMNLSGSCHTPLSTPRFDGTAVPGMRRGFGTGRCVALRRAPVGSSRQRRRGVGVVVRVLRVRERSALPIGPASGSGGQVETQASSHSNVSASAGTISHRATTSSVPDETPRQKQRTVSEFTSPERR